MIEKNIKKNNTSVLFFSIFLVVFLLLFMYKYLLNVNKFEILKNDNLIMAKVEKLFEKQYPIGNDFFTIKHFPKYCSFFEQFVKNNYYVWKENNKISGTICISEFKNKLKYICDLKSCLNGKNMSFKFMFRYYCDTMFSKNCYNVFNQVFGIVMQPNKAIDNIAKKYWFLSCEILLLYQISYDEYEKNKLLFKKLFVDHFFVAGYKKLTLASTNAEIKICHIATKNDLNYVKKQQLPLNITNEYEIMFCLPKSNSFVNSLNNLNIKSSSNMTIFSIFNNLNTDWNFIKTYMI